MDDLLIIASSKSQAAHQAAEVKCGLTQLGFIVSHKSMKVPSTIAPFLGVVINSIDMSVSLPEGKLDKIHQIAKNLRSKLILQLLSYKNGYYSNFIILVTKTVSIREILQILGHASFAIIAVPTARLHMRELQQLTVPLQIIKAPLHQKVQLTPAALLELQFWERLTKLQATKQIHVSPPVYHLFTDASDDGWGAWCRDQALSHKWPRLERQWRINEKELKAIYLAFKHFAKYFAGRKLY